MSAVPEKGHSPSPVIRSLASLRFIMNANCPICLHNISRIRYGSENISRG